jgi:hypothetical protein
MRKDIHQPTLSTIRMVERTIKKRKNFKWRNHLFTKLPKRVMHQTITTILAYLVESKKVTVNRDGSIVWIFADSSKIKKRLTKSKSKIRTSQSRNPRK